MQILLSLLAGLKAVCATFPDARKGRGGNIEISDFGVSFSMFFMQSASFLAFQRGLEKGQGRSNGQTLFGIGRIPSDNYIRDRLDEADPALLQPCFERVESLLAEPSMRQAFGRLGGRTLIAWDGTEYFCSQKLGCPNCLTRERSNGTTENYHCLLSATVVAPGHSKVVPLMPEFVATRTAPRNRTASAMPSSAGSPSTARGSRRSARSFWAMICSPVTPSARWSRMPATTSSSPARQPRTRRSTTSSTAPSFRGARRRFVAATPRRRSVTAGSRRFRSRLIPLSQGTRSRPLGLYGSIRPL